MLEYRFRLSAIWCSTDHCRYTEVCEKKESDMVKVEVKVKMKGRSS
jgi:hypothetical protein